VFTVAHASDEEHSLPVGQVVAQYVSPPICAHTPPLQSLSVRHGVQLVPLLPPFEPPLLLALFVPLPPNAFESTED
jgi:hypothetical protein